MADLLQTLVARLAGGCTVTLGLDLGGRRLILGLGLRACGEIFLCAADLALHGQVVGRLRQSQVLKLLAGGERGL